MGLFKSKKNNTQEIITSKIVEFSNPMYKWRHATNWELAQLFAKAQAKLIRDRMDSFGKDRWFVSNDPVIIALKQFDMGKEFVTTENAFTSAVSHILELEEILDIDEIKDNWYDYFEAVKEKVGERAKEIIEISDETLEDILRIDLD